MATVPFVPLVTEVTVSGSASGSLSLVLTVTVTAVLPGVVTESFTATGGKSGSTARSAMTTVPPKPEPTAVATPVLELTE